MADGLALLLAGEGEGGGMDAMVSGTLTGLGGCLGIRVEQEVYPVIWPVGTSLDSDGSAVLVGEERFLLGDRLTGSGGFLTSPLPDSAPAVPRDCASERGEAVWLDSASAAG